MAQSIPTASKFSKGSLGSARVHPRSGSPARPVREGCRPSPTDPRQGTRRAGREEPREPLAGRDRRKCGNHSPGPAALLRLQREPDHRGLAGARRPRRSGRHERRWLHGVPRRRHHQVGHANEGISRTGTSVYGVCGRRHRPSPPSTAASSASATRRSGKRPNAGSRSPSVKAGWIPPSTSRSPASRSSVSWTDSSASSGCSRPGTRHRGRPAECCPSPALPTVDTARKSEQRLARLSRPRPRLTTCVTPSRKGHGHADDGASVVMTNPPGGGRVYRESPVRSSCARLVRRSRLLWRAASTSAASGSARAASPVHRGTTSCGVSL